ncbi:MAG: hypothetical protein L3V56_09520 [Candidatus Magnetoovum sp. WYHC-5]|nr:hypothetical protein [Candidatus Magnetoovum sp. WYHC-5]
MKRGLVYLGVLGVVLFAMVVFNGGSQSVSAGTCNCLLPYLSTQTVLPTTCVVTNSASDNLTVSFRLRAGNASSGSISTTSVALGGLNAFQIEQWQFKSGSIFLGAGTGTNISAANTVLSNSNITTDTRYAGILTLAGGGANTTAGTDGSVYGPDFSCPNVGITCFQSSPSSSYKAIKRPVLPLCSDEF